jgi:hypothetical protein
MIKLIKLFITFLLAIIVLGANAQSTSTQATTSSPYSQFGLGELVPQVLPQNLAMGGVATATNSFGGYYNINPLNPASYAAIHLTVIDIGISSNINTLSQTGAGSETNGNFRLSHFAFAFPVTKNSAFAFGLEPYSQVGYNYLSSSKHTAGPVDTNVVNNLYTGNGGLSKAYLGYGFSIGHLNVGANVSYIFGNIQQFQSTELPDLFGTLDSRIENSYQIRGLNYDYGAQYTFDLSETKHLTLGYSASANSQLNSQYSHIVSQYNYDSEGNQNIPLDSIIYTKTPSAKIRLPQINHFGIAFSSNNHYLIGADYTRSNWSGFSLPGQTENLQNSQTVNLGGQLTPNINALHNYWATVNYRLGFIYDQSYIDVSNPDNNGTTNIKSYAVTMGLGFPLRPGYSSFYNINFTAEVGREGTLANGLIKENYVNLHLSFTLNDKWFQKYRIGE